MATRVWNGGHGPTSIRIRIIQLTTLPQAAGVAVSLPPIAMMKMPVTDVYTIK